ncbi:hypothetical protein ASPFODRAFT_619670 [Aspergillus luchuensis CBS 106.47]|uniref:Uncharacterized protein n=1 Tax=Aspergillus luchuensis (strain CBS 106.47) TaxID=1137211 RepID=A0A1M3SYD7_ASPLC|nr:hypothetical protein ASPFODRAFT_619670 [Aspergillus luchuensis CBS 106.47]
MPAQIARRRRHRKLFDHSYSVILSSCFTGSLSPSFTVTLYSQFGASLPPLPSSPLFYTPFFSPAPMPDAWSAGYPAPPLGLPSTATRDLRRRSSHSERRMSHPAWLIAQHGAESCCAKVKPGLGIRVLMRGEKPSE